jgi:asparagine synthase (glutamine-hydrolysing)
VRDPIGIKPLYFSWVGKSIRFGSEIKAILALPDQPRALSRNGLHSFFAQGYPGPKRSLVDGIAPLPPGCILVADRNGFTIEQYWRPRRSHAHVRLEEALETFQTLWPKVVGDMLISDVPVGLLLSGGIDSALVATALAGHNEVRAYTGKFSDASFDETGLAAVSAKYAGLDQKLVSIDAEEVLQTRFLDVVSKVDGQLADSSCLAFYSLCQRARKDTPVLLTGDGADEFFAGYETYRVTRLAAWLNPVLPRTVARSISRGASAFGGLNRGRVSALDKVARFFGGIASGGACPHTQWRRYLFPEDARFVYGDELADLAESVDPLADYGDAYDTAAAPMDAALLSDQQHYLPGDLLMKSDSMSMAHGVEVRVPFLDRRMMEFANSLHPALVSPLRGPDKRLLRASLNALGLPEELTRAGKRGFNVPVDAYLRGPLRPLGDKLLDKNASRLEPLLRPDAVRTLWKRHLDGDSRFSYVLWTTLTFAAWRDIASV